MSIDSKIVIDYLDTESDLLKCAHSISQNRKKMCKTRDAFSIVQLHFPEHELTTQEYDFKERICDQLAKRGFETKENGEFLYECHYYDIKDGDEFIPEFGWHEDNYGGVGCRVHTFIIYLAKSKEISGGNFAFKNEEGETQIVDVRGGLVVYMDGSVPHTIEPMCGKGTRNSIVIQLEKA